MISKYSDFLAADQAAEEFWNKDSEGDYKLSPQEMADKLEQELLDTINRVPHEPSEAADKGTALNEVIDCMLLRKKSTRDDVVLKSDRTAEIPLINAKINDFSFDFSMVLCQDIAKDLAGAIPQYRCSAILPTKYGDVELYGDVDYILRDLVIDLKTTGRYNFGKYELGWQKDLYPYCLIESGMMTDVPMFIYYIVNWVERAGMPITGNLYKEEYVYDHAASTARLTSICERLAEYLESHRDVITNKKIFNQE